MAKKLVKGIPLESIIKIEVSGHFYLRIQQMLVHMSAEKTKEEFVKILEKLKSNEKTDSLYEYNLFTILSLIHEIEKQAEAQNKLEDKEVDIPENGTDL
jgi:tRNA nucleotidyltransferase/poly(A) polymerase